MPSIIKNISKKYPTYEKIIQYKRAWTPMQSDNKQPIKNKPTGLIDLRNVSRAKTAIHDIVACNTFEYFVTLTVAPGATIDRYNYDECAKAISKWLNNHLDKYILVPEKHKDGAYHFHLLADIPSHKLKHHRGRVYNIKSFKYGHTTAIKIKDGSEARIANYVQKYITKDLISTVGTGRRRYWASRNLKRPEKNYNVLIPSNAQVVHTNDHIDIYKSLDSV